MDGSELHLLSNIMAGRWLSAWWSLTGNWKQLFGDPHIFPKLSPLNGKKFKEKKWLTYYFLLCKLGYFLFSSHAQVMFL